MTKEEYIEILKKQLDELNDRIGEIERRAKNLKEHLRSKLQTRIKYLYKKRDAVLSKMDEIKNVNTEVWKDLRQSTENIVDSLKDVVTKTLARFKKSKEDVIAEKLNNSGSSNSESI